MRGFFRTRLIIAFDWLIGTARAPYLLIQANAVGGTAPSLYYSGKDSQKGKAFAVPYQAGGNCLIMNLSLLLPKERVCQKKLVHPLFFCFLRPCANGTGRAGRCPKTTILYLLILSLLSSFTALAGKSFPTAFEHLLALVLRAVLGLGVYLNQTVIHNLLNFCEHCKVMPFQLQAEENATEIQYFSPISWFMSK